MAEKIESKYYKKIRAYSVYFPEHVTLDHLNNWKREFQEMLDVRSHPKPEALILDTNKHDFESIECLRILRSILSQLVNQDNGIYKIAFVQPVQYRKPEVISKNEAYFEDVEKAKLWLRG